MAGRKGKKKKKSQNSLGIILDLVDVAVPLYAITSSEKLKESVIVPLLAVQEQEQRLPN